MSIDYSKSSTLLRQAYFAYKKHCKEKGLASVSATTFAAGWNSACWCKASQ